MKQIGLSLIIIWTFSCSNQQGEYEWKSYKEDVNTGFTIEYLLPLNEYSNRIENGMCIGPKTSTGEQENELLNEGWCIWMDDTSDFDIEEEIRLTKSQFTGNWIENRYETLIAGEPAIGVVISDTMGTYIETVYFHKFNTLFTLTNKNRNNKKFERFLKSIKLYQ